MQLPPDDAAAADGLESDAAAALQDPAAAAQQLLEEAALEHRLECEARAAGGGSGAQHSADDEGQAGSEEEALPEIREYLAIQGLEGLLSGSRAEPAAQDLAMPPAGDGGHIGQPGHSGQRTAAPALLGPPRDDELDTDANMLEVR
jgi:hypothetical protein